MAPLPYSVQIELAAWYNQSSRTEAVVHLSIAPDGEVLQVLVDRMFYEQQNMEQLIPVLRQSRAVRLQLMIILIIT